jgi:hypothetical protein
MISALMVVEEKLALAVPLPRARHIMSDFTDVSRTKQLLRGARTQVSGKYRARVAADGASTSRPRDLPHSLHACPLARTYEP